MSAISNCCIIKLQHFLVGEWLSLVEHLVRDQGVGGSNPLSPTNSSSKSGACKSTKYVMNPNGGAVLLDSGATPRMRRRHSGNLIASRVASIDTGSYFLPSAYPSRVMARSVDR